MPQSLKAIKGRIKSIQNTRKVTNAMQMISVAKLNRVDKVLFALRPYALALENLLDNLVALQPEGRHPFLVKRSPVKARALCIITSDNSLCGLYNTIVLRVAEDFLVRYGQENVLVSVIGRRGYSFCKSRKIAPQSVYLGLNGRYDAATADKVSSELIGLFLQGKADEVWCAHAHFENVVTLKPSLEKVLPLEPKRVEARQYIVEPRVEVMLEKVALETIIMKMRRVIAEGFTAEHAARVVAMKAATDNAKELLEVLTLTRNKMRQASITQEILEIISSAEALRG